MAAGDDRAAAPAAGAVPAPSAAAEERGMRHEIVLGVAVLALVAGTVSAQDRKAQAVTGVGLASLGVYAALADRDCVYPWESMLDSLCGWRTTDEHTVGVDPDLPREQLVSGLAVAGIGGLMAGGAWRPSKSVDAAFTAGAGILLLAVARDDGYPRGTVVVHGEEGSITVTCPGAGGLVTYEFRGTGGDCYRTFFSRPHTMWAGIAALGLAAGRLLWREPPLTVSVRPSGVWVGQTIEF